ncbi:MAG: condensation domain-containing protein, partial [Actinoplanes sp.]
MRDTMGTGLLWAQQYHWANYWLEAPAQRWRNNVRSMVPVPDGVSADQVAGALERLTAAHEALRTVYPGGVRTVLPAASPQVEIKDVTGEPDLGWATAYFDELLRVPFDLETEPQARYGLVVAGGRPRWLFFVFHHIAIDTFGVMAFQRHLA